jgi:drug/metabolite transporter (DMT)-like permease
MKHRLSASQYLVLLAVMISASIGDAMLSRGMAQIGIVDVHHLRLLMHALLNPWIDGGILILAGFFASYTTALSFADLTFVMPATAFSQVITALIARFWLHEQLSLARWAGIVLIFCAVGFVANGPSLTSHDSPPTPDSPPHPDLRDAGVAE